MCTHRKQISGCLRPRVQVIELTRKEYERTLHDRKVQLDYGGGYTAV